MSADPDDVVKTQTSFIALRKMYLLRNCHHMRHRRAYLSKMWLLCTKFCKPN